MITIDLINSEGPILVLKYDKATRLFHLTDELHKELAKFTMSALILFLRGSIIVYDSKGREWDFPKVESGMSVSPEKLMTFLEDCD